LYRENSGRIPMWAWQTAHHMEERISTPIAEGRTVNASGNINFTTNGFNVTILPDRIVRRLEPPARIEAHIMVMNDIEFSHEPSGEQLVTRFVPPASPTVQIQTIFRRGVTAASRSAYGRGTTAEDVAGGAVTPASTSIGFHEATHGLAVVEFLEHNPPPRFAGAVGMTRVAFEAEFSQWQRATHDYENHMNAFIERHGHCVGTTIDQFRQAQARPGTRIVLECGPREQPRVRESR
jgi:hypothetical protein